MARYKDFWDDQEIAFPKMAADHLYLKSPWQVAFWEDPSAQIVQESLLPFRALGPEIPSPLEHSAPFLPP